MEGVRIVIDIGTNSVRRLILRNYEDKEEVSKSLITTRLGKDVAADGKLNKDSIKRTIDGVVTLILEGLNIFIDAKVNVFATSALREAPNRDEFLELLKKKIGQKVHIISGEQEAILAFAGAVEINDLAGVIDIGGGSTEVMLGQNNVIEYVQSLKLGVVRLQNDFDMADVMEDRERERMESYVNDIVNSYTLERERARCAKWYGVGGTITVIAAMEKGIKEYKPSYIQGIKITYDMVKKWYGKLSMMSLEQKMLIDGLPKERADIIVGGAYILLSLMGKLGIKVINISDSDNLEGYIKIFG